MKKLYTLLAACALSAGLSACGQSSVISPESPRYDGGSTFGTGHSTDSTAVVISATETTTEDGVTAERGGFTAGTGH